MNDENILRNMVPYYLIQSENIMEIMIDLFEKYFREFLVKTAMTKIGLSKINIIMATISDALSDENRLKQINNLLWSKYKHESTKNDRFKVISLPMRYRQIRNSYLTH